MEMTICLHMLVDRVHTFKAPKAAAKKGAAAAARSVGFSGVPGAFAFHIRQDV